MDTAIIPTTANTANCIAAAAAVQHVTKKSSDELLRKFAETSDEEDEANKKLSKRRKTRKKSALLSCESPNCYSTITSSSAVLVERRSLLPVPVVSRKCRAIGIARSSQLRARDLKNKSILVAIHKTWRRTLEGASKLLLEKHYNRHRRLINDVL
ncbi:uncharacterized protein LOC126678023 [Mercurialis annua]|uniref:uncharacterized protein LOC126678023 n=1 Tax=Mercurialis annua TaxID=3986 RepID=UPI002160D779|nr:uncharacterized protein LOC126678023 [Mercurialis annua]